MLESTRSAGIVPRSDFDLMDRSADPALDELTEFAAVLSNADYAYMGWLDFNRLWFKSRFGFSATDQARTDSACQFVVEHGEPLLVRDAAGESRFGSTALTLPGSKPCRSYAGVPLVGTNQQVLGTLAVLARKPNQFCREHLTLLEVLGRQFVTRIELFNRVRAQEQAQRARQRTERALAMERIFVATTLDSIPALVVVLDTAGRIVRFNQPCAQMTGLSLTDTAGRPFVDELLEADDRLWASHKLRDAAGGQVSGPHETPWRIAGKQLRRVSWTLRPLKGPNGEIQYLIISGQDVTDQREAEQALLSSETRYREVVESSLGFVFTCTMEGRLSSLNAFTAETLGYRIEDLMGRHVAELLDPAGAATFQECLRTLRNNEEWQGALPVRRSDGIYRRIACRSRRMKLMGDLHFILIHGIDVTEQHEAEEALHLAMRQRELILESVGDGICGIDLEGRLTFINEAGARTLGYKPEELTGRHVHEVIHHGHLDGTPYSKLTSPILQGMRRRETVRMRDEVFWRHDGSTVPVEYTASPLFEDGQISGMVIAFQDVSERRRLEKMKDEFISTVSHELRTPLTSLRAALGLISSGSLDKRPEKQRQMVEMAIGNCDRLVRLVNDILDFERVEQGRLSMHRVPIKASDLLRRAADVAHTMANDVRITFQIGPGREMVLADPERALQVLNELVANAIKFSPPDTVIRLGTEPAGEGEVSFVVEDQGRGVAPEKLDHIFDRFQQGDASDTRALGGTGLGLALCRSIVEQHGGRIWVENKPTQGSRFLFTLPAAMAAAQ
jgi:PAS domain S-box-containing protein